MTDSAPGNAVRPDDAAAVGVGTDNNAGAGGEASAAGAGADGDVMERVDVVLIGGGVMSATVGTLLAQLEPSWTIRLYERLGGVAREASHPWNNAGTGHAALCELNYTPAAPDGSVPVDLAVSINRQFAASRDLWTALEGRGLLHTDKFCTTTPHMTFVRGTGNVAYLRKRFEALQGQPGFESMNFTDDAATIGSWAPLLTAGRNGDEPVAATRVTDGTDVDFGALTRQLVDSLQAGGTQVHTNHEIVTLRRSKSGWRLSVLERGTARIRRVEARFVFVGAGGGTLPLLQAAGIPEARNYGGFPISGKFLVTSAPEIVAQHDAKVYGMADIGAPPMSVPHLDTRIINGKRYLVFGPFAGFSPRFLKHGLPFGLFTTLRWHNLPTMMQAGLANLDLVKYLVGEVFAPFSARIAALRAFMPGVWAKDWTVFTAGQRVQVIKRDPRTGKGVLAFGTEVVTAADGSIAGLLGASP
ncbi:MAG: malate dehydrogenase (quinone), partial [Cellulomonadaceae bacterium]|nr:malate dehydrogenase (quinone) [Cellulomonadaceae bacterium]